MTINEQIEDSTTEELIYEDLYKKVWYQLYKAKIGYRYYRMIADRRKLYRKTANFLTLLGSSSTIVTIMADLSPWPILLASAATLAAFLNIVCDWSSEETKFLKAASMLDGLLLDWNRLWQDIKTYSYSEIGEVKEELTRLCKEDNNVAGFVGAHDEDFCLRKRRRRIIQENLDNSKEMEYL